MSTRTPQVTTHSHTAHTHRLYGLLAGGTLSGIIAWLTGLTNTPIILFLILAATLAAGVILTIYLG